jgi:hypothetical protein
VTVCPTCARLRAALIAFVDHFGPIEDNEMLNDGARRCFGLARAALEDRGDVGALYAAISGATPSKEPGRTA